MSAGDRWLLAFVLSALVLLVGGTLLRRIARTPEARGVRRRSGALLALGPVLGGIVTGDRTLVVGVVAVVALAAVGAVAERRADGSRLSALAVTIASVVVVLAGARLGPTGVSALDALAAFLFIAAVTAAFDGVGNADGLAR